MHLQLNIIVKLVFLLSLLPIFCHAQESYFSIGVNEKGDILLPENYKLDYVFLGSWFLDLKDKDMKLIQNVYSRKDDVLAYRKTNQWPDGAILVKEQNLASDSDIGVAIESYSEKIIGVFVMVKDRKNRFPENPIWGDGWGWSFFDKSDYSKTVTTDYKKDCISCHLPVKDTDYVFTKGYRALLQEK